METEKISWNKESWNKESWNKEKPNKNRMTKVITLFLIAMNLMLFCACGGGTATKEEVKTDYESVRDVITDYNEGKSVNGKTVKVTALMMPTAGMIATIPDQTTGKTTFVYLNSDDGDRKNVTGIREGVRVVLRIDSVENLLERGYFIYGIAEEKLQ